MIIVPQRIIADYDALKEELRCRSYADAVNHFIDKGCVIREGDTGKRAYFDMNYKSLAVTIMETEHGLCEINTYTIEYYGEDEEDAE